MGKPKNGKGKSLVRTVATAKSGRRHPGGTGHGSSRSTATVAEKVNGGNGNGELVEITGVIAAVSARTYEIEAVDGKYSIPLVSAGGLTAVGFTPRPGLQVRFKVDATTGVRKSGVHLADERPMEGTIASFNPERGYGFIRPDGTATGGEDYFFHRTWLHPEGDNLSPQKGRRVQFNLVEINDKRQADWVLVLDEAREVETEEMVVLTGTIQHINHEKKYGFIVPDGDGFETRCFFHESWIGRGSRDQLIVAGRRVQFVLREEDGKHQARRVEILEPDKPDEVNLAAVA